MCCVYKGLTSMGGNSLCVLPQKYGTLTTYIFYQWHVTESLYTLSLWRLLNNVNTNCEWLFWAQSPCQHEGEVQLELILQFAFIKKSLLAVKPFICQTSRTVGNVTWTPSSLLLSPICLSVISTQCVRVASVGPTYGCDSKLFID